MNTKKKRTKFFAKAEIFLKKYQNIISFLFGIIGIFFGLYKGFETISYKDKIQYVTTTLDSTRDANGILTIKTTQTTLELNDLKKLSENGDARIRALLDEINKAYKKTKVKTDTVVLSTLKIHKDTVYIRDTIIKIRPDTTRYKDTIKDTINERKHSENRERVSIKKLLHK